MNGTNLATTIAFNLTDDINKQMMLKFLERHYPVIRVKFNNRFKRAVMLDGGEIFMLGDEFHKIQLKTKLIEILNLVFYCKTEISLSVLNNFLTLK